MKISGKIIEFCTRERKYLSKQENERINLGKYMQQQKWSSQ